MSGDAGLILGLGRSLGVGNGNPLHYSCHGNPMDFLYGYSLWSCKNQAQLSTNTHTHKLTTRHKESHFVIQRECLRNNEKAEFILYLWKTKFLSVQFSCSVVSDSLWPHGLQQTRLSCPSPTPEIYLNSCPSSWWCHPIISFSVAPFSSHLQSFPSSGSFPMSQFFASGGQSIGVSAATSLLPMNTQDWSSLGLTGLISLQSKGLSRVSSNTTVQKHQFFGAQLAMLVWDK